MSLLIRNFLIAFSLIVFCMSCNNTSSEKVYEAIKRGDKIISALESFYKEDGTYPKSLQDLVPNYISLLPNPGLTKDDKFLYILIPKSKNSLHFYGYRLSFYVHRLFFDLRSAKRYIYLPSEKYPTTNHEVTHKLVGKWAYQTAYRKYQ